MFFFPSLARAMFFCLKPTLNVYSRFSLTSRSRASFGSGRVRFTPCHASRRKLPASAEGTRRYVIDCRELLSAQIERGNRSITIKLCHPLHCPKFNCQKMRDSASHSDCYGSVCQPVRAGNGLVWYSFVYMCSSNPPFWTTLSISESYPAG